VICGIPYCKEEFESLEEYYCHYAEKHLLNWGRTSYSTIIMEGKE